MKFAVIHTVKHLEREEEYYGSHRYPASYRTEITMYEYDSEEGFESWVLRNPNPNETVRFIKFNELDVKVKIDWCER